MVLFNHSVLLNTTLLASTHFVLDEVAASLKFKFELGTYKYRNLVADYTPSNFFDNFNFFTDDDPTHGYVDYVSEAEAYSERLISTPITDLAGPAYMGVDHTNVASGRGRKSVRLISKASFTRGLFLLDVDHMPYGCGTWPAFWTLGPDWPNNGEIDIIEGVNSNNFDNMALHTSTGCTIDGSGATTAATSTNCDVNVDYNVGCAFHNNNSLSYGSDFNNNGGGLYAMEWRSGYIKVWFFTRGSIPEDAMGPAPEPANWGTPAAYFNGGCDIDSHFAAHQIVFDTTFCGDWAGNVWGSQCSALGSTCQDYVQNNPTAFADAYWAINRLRVFN